MKCIQSILAALLTVVILISTSGCMFMRLKEDLKKGEENIGLIRGHADYTNEESGPVIILLFDSLMAEHAIIDYVIVNRPSQFAFVVPAGRYMVAAFQDRNRNMRPDPGEPTGRYGAPDIIEVVKPGPIRNIDVTLDDQVSDEVDDFWQGHNLEDVTGRVYTGGVGILADLDNPKFSPEYAVKGLWEPNAFMKEVGYGLLFLGPYDPDRIPVLFVYGASGHAQNWRYLFDGLDRRRYQPWFFNYPTGLDLAFSGGVLNECIKVLNEQYGFDHLFIVAHSMGGLVARYAILKNVYVEQQDYIKLLVTISTPWGGHKAAAAGVRHAPTVVPSWRNMVPESAFIANLYTHDLPMQIPHHLIFSYSGRSGMMDENNDGAVTIESQLDYRVQSAATKLYGLQEDHVGILFSEDVVRTLNGVLDDRWKALNPGVDWEKLLGAPEPTR